MSVAVMAVAIMVIVCSRHGLWLSSSNPFWGWLISQEETMGHHRFPCPTPESGKQGHSNGGISGIYSYIPSQNQSK